ncbi:TrmB family transcriptional regulator [Halobacteriales archaeon QS_4_69_34]|nr:MAG: TrmB family transcriptional regulator [Halobacteriales archaeon QS_4_69_34]
MSEDERERTQAEAVRLLGRLGLSEYAASVYTTLLRLGPATARQISEASAVPRTRVYDAVDALEQEGLVDVRYASPKVFSAASRETTTRRFQLDYKETVERLSTVLADLEPAQRRREQTGVWTVSGHEAVTERVLEFVGEADTEVVYMSVEELLTGEVIEALAAVEQRGVDIQLAGVSPATRDRIRTEIPSAELFETLWEWSDTTAGRLLMVDRETILVSVYTDDDTPEETAIWGSGDRNSLVVVLKAIFTWRLNNAEKFAND